MSILHTEDRKTILIALGVGIFLIYIQSLVLRSADLIFNLLLSLGEGIADMTIQLTANGDPNLLTHNTHLMILVFSFAAFMVLYGYMSGNIESRNMKVLDILSELEGNEKSVRKESTEPTLEEKKQICKDRLKNLNRARRPLRLLIIIGIIWFGFHFFYGIVCDISNTYNVRFRNDLTVLSVYLSDAEIKQLRANWVQMKTKKDYLEVKNQIDAYYKKFGIKGDLK